MNNKPTTHAHGFPPIIGEDSEILILGSFPSVKSRKDTFYYMHKQNRFWKVLSRLFEDELFLSRLIEAKIKALENHHIALYDVIEQCDIEGSKDASIKNVVPTDVKKLIENTSVHTIVLNGKKAEELFKKHNRNLSQTILTMPSTSPANARYDMDRLMESWKRLLNNQGAIT